MQIHNIFDALPDNLQEEVFEQLVNSDTIKIERIISRGQRSPESGWYDQPQNEWVMLLKGEARLAFENLPDVHLKSGDYLSIAAHTRHRVDWTPADRETIWLAVHY